MPGPLKRVNSVADEIIGKKFRELLLMGNWPECEYHSTGDGMQSYNMMKFATKQAQYSKAVHNKLISAGFEFGIFQNARNDKYRKTIQGIVAGLTVAEVDASERFKTAMWD